MSAAPDGRMRLHTETTRVLGIPAKKLMEIFGLSLDDVVTIKNQQGVEIREDDILIDPGRVLPPPRIEGRLASVDLANGRLTSDLLVGSREATFARTSRLRRQALRVLRGQPDPVRQAAHERARICSSSTRTSAIRSTSIPAKYRTQLVAGYSKNTPSGGLRTYMPDLQRRDAAHRSPASAPKV